MGNCNKVNNLTNFNIKYFCSEGYFFNLRPGYNTLGYFDIYIKLLIDGERLEFFLTSKDINVFTKNNKRFTTTLENDGSILLTIENI